MNVFTKEELEIIGQCFETISHKKFMENKSIQPVFLKIRSMIDNYCDHTPSDSHYEMFRWQLCQKCGLQYK